MEMVVTNSLKGSIRDLYTGLGSTRFLSGTLLPFFFRVAFSKPNSRKKGVPLL